MRFLMTWMAVGLCFCVSFVLLAGEPSRATGKNVAVAVDISASAQAIDQLIAAELKKHGQAPRGQINDYTFCRRIYLALYVF